MRCLLCLLGMIALHAGAPLAAFAQQSQPDQELRQDAARGAFERGMKAVERKDWGAALVAFEKSFELEPSPKTRINIALVQVELSLLVEAHAHLAAVANSTLLSSKTRSAAGEQAAELSKRIPTIELEIHNMLPTDRLYVEGIETKLFPGETAIAVNPGRHTLNIMRDGRIIVSERVFVREGAVTRVVLDAKALPSAGQGGQTPSKKKVVDSEERVQQSLTPDVAAGAESDDGTVLEQWWFWTAMGAVVAGSVVAVLLVTANESGGCIPDEPGCHEL